jgi:hypothetical protein
MANSRIILRQDSNGDAAVFKPFTLNSIGKDEAFLEEIIAEHPELLGLESRQKGIYSPFVVFRQVNLKTPNNRSIIPDIVILSASGDVIIIEVKRFDNPELRDRRVIAQIIDYAASFSALSKKEIVSAFNRNHQQIKKWEKLVTVFFPEESDIDDLSNTLLHNIQTGRLHLIIACEKAPSGLKELIRGVVKQSALDFELGVMQITPYLNPDSGHDEIIFISATILETETIARTVVTVSHQEGQVEPSVDVQTTTMEEIEEKIDQLRAGKTSKYNGREWEDSEIDDAFYTHDDPLIGDLFNFAKQNSAYGQVNAPGLKVNSSFGFYIGNKNSSKQCFNYTNGNSYIKIYINLMSTLYAHDKIEEFRAKLYTVFADPKIKTLKEPSIKLSEIGENLDEFKTIILWLKGLLHL